MPLLAEIFRASIEELTMDDYSEAQQAAWASTADDEEELGARLAAALHAGRDVRWSGGGLCLACRQHARHMLYVSPIVAGQGAGAMLCDALEKLSAARGAKDLSVEASDTARGFFEKRGFVAQDVATRITLAGEWLANTTMVKPLGRQRHSCNETRRLAVPAPLALLSDREIRGHRGGGRHDILTVYRLYRG